MTKTNETNAATKPASLDLSPSGRTIVVGDIHGCLAELHALLAKLEFGPDDLLVSAGDFVDRGPDSLGVWEFLRDTPNATAIMGNHERKHVRGGLGRAQEFVKLQMGRRYEEFRTWAADLPYFLELPEAIVVHGGLEDGVPLEQQDEQILSATLSGSKRLAKKYGRTYWPERYTGTKPVVFGHHIVGEEPRVFEGERARVYAIDTGACHGDYLSALVLPDFTLHRVKASADHWAESIRRWTRPMLEARPWASLRFAKIERELVQLRGPAASRDFAQELATWVQEHHALIPALIARLHARRAELEAAHGHPARKSPEEKPLRKAIAAAPDGSLLFSSRAGSLDAATVLDVLGTPEALASAARRHGLSAPDPQPAK